MTLGSGVSPSCDGMTLLVIDEALVLDIILASCMIQLLNTR